MKVLLAGTSGAIGSKLADSLRGHGHSVRTLVRRAPTNDAEFTWRPDRGELDPVALGDVDAVICLSGAGIADKRWTDEYKQILRSSRVDTVGTIARTMAAVESPPATLLAASAVGYYGDTGAQTIDESAPAGTSFLSSLCIDWEAAAAPAEAAGVRVAHLRTGLVLDRHSGLMAKLLPLFKLGVGGKMGSGDQYWPWISITDEVAAIEFVLSSTVSGAVNLTGPAPTTCADFASTLGGVVHRPAILPVPGFALRIALGEFASDVLTGQRAIPAKLLDAGFSFSHKTLTDALQAELT